MYSLLAVGTDAEVFLRNLAKEPIPVIGLLGGTKWEPLAVPELGEGFAVQEDNVMPEFNVPASATAKEFSSNIGRMLDYLDSTFKKKGLTIDVASSIRFPESMLKHPQAMTFGCEPDLNVWKRKKNINPSLNKEAATLRTAAAHVHVSFTKDGKPVAKDDIFSKEPIVKALEVTLSLPSLTLDTGGVERRKMYGKAGSFRSKPYGIEHRVLSNFWIKTPELRQWLFNGVVSAFALANTHYKHIQGHASLIEQAINDNDKNMAAQLLDFYDMTTRLTVPAAA